MAFPADAHTVPSARPGWAGGVGRWRTAVPLAAAAVLAAVLFGTPNRAVESPIRRPAQMRTALRAQPPGPGDTGLESLEVTRSDRDFALMTTENPNVAVVWFFWIIRG